MAKYKYQNTSEDDLAITNVGTVKAGQIIESDEPIENPNLQLVEEPKKKEEVKK